MFCRGGKLFIWENRRDWPWYNKLICKRTCNRISYINKMFSNLSVSYRWQLSLPKRALPLVRFKMMMFYSGKLFWTTLPVFAKRSHHPPLHVMPCGYKEGKFCCLLGLLFYNGKSVHIICNEATNGRPYGVSVIYFCQLQVNVFVN